MKLPLRIRTPFTALITLTLLAHFGCRDADAPRQADKRVYVEETGDGYRLIKDGAPFFVKGACVGAAEHWAAFREAGGNTIRIYDPTDLAEKLDLADSLGLMVAVDLPLPRNNEEYRPYEDSLLVETFTRRISRTVKAFRDHPALLFWNLGNEVNYPPYFGERAFVRQFNAWIDLVHELDPNHPVTSPMPDMSRLVTLNMHWRSPKLDFLSYNTFGRLNTMPPRLRVMAPFWKGPLMITEWGINGPWEAREKTTWGAPVEPTSSKKAALYRERYQKIMELDPGRTMGSFLFYWGEKEERTPTWFSPFLKDGRRTEVPEAAARIFEGAGPTYDGPRLGHILLEGLGAPASITLVPGQNATASIQNTSPDLSGLEVRWELHPENWFRLSRTEWGETAAIPTEFLEKSPWEVVFKTPETEGPYRLYLYLGDAQGQVATANIPFYILDPDEAR